MNNSLVLRTHSIFGRIRDHGFRTAFGMALTRLQLVVTQPRFTLKAWWARMQCMTLGPNATLHWTATVFGHARISVGRDFFLGPNALLKAVTDGLEPGALSLQIGNNVRVRNGVILDASYSVTIGDNTTIGPYCLVIDSNHCFHNREQPIRDQGCSYKPVRIGKDCWIGAHSVILPGVTIGDHAVIGANSTVTRDVPPFTVAAGSPAKVKQQI